MSTCVDAHVTRYLVTGNGPADGTHCASDIVPFEPLPQAESGSDSESESEAEARGTDASREQARRDAREAVIAGLPGGTR